MSGNKPHDLERLFYPKSLAVVGATPRVGGFNWGGNNFIEGSINLGFQGRIYPVHPSGLPILGFQSYRSIRDIPDEIDLVVFSVSCSQSLKLMQDCVDKKVKFVHVFAAGFSETGLAENTAMENELVSMARKAGIRIIGPNCMGVYCPKGGLGWNREFSKDSGEVSFASQSGQLAGEFIEVGFHEGIRFNKLVSFGNACDLQIHDFLHYFLGDEKTKIVASYLEGMRDGDAFFEAAKEVARVKPLIVWRGGMTEGGSRASQSHTGAIAGSAQVWEAICRQTGIIPVRSMEELVSTTSALLRQPLPRSASVAILGGAGGGSVTMTDLAERAGLKVPHLSEATIRGLAEFIPIQGSIIKNPLDIMSTLFYPARKTGTNYAEMQENYRRIFALLREDPNIDGLIYAQRMELLVRIGGRHLMDFFIRGTIDALKELKKPVFIALDRSRTLEGEAIRQGAQEQYIRAGFATFPNFSTAAQVVYNLDNYRKFLDASSELG